MTYSKAYSGHGLFFAIMVPHMERTLFVACLEEMRRTYSFRSQPIAPDRLHLSLFGVYRGDSLPEAAVNVAIAAGDAIQSEPLSIRFNSALTYRNRGFRKPLVLPAQEGTDAIEKLRFRIGSALSGLLCSERYRHRPIRPHITLIWDQTMVPERPVTPIAIKIREFALVHSHIGKSKYDIVKRWPLAT